MYTLEQRTKKLTLGLFSMTFQIFRLQFWPLVSWSILKDSLFLHVLSISESVSNANPNVSYTYICMQCVKAQLVQSQKRCHKDDITQAKFNGFIKIKKRKKEIIHDVLEAYFNFSKLLIKEVALDVLRVMVCPIKIVFVLLQANLQFITNCIPLFSFVLSIFQVFSKFRLISH